MRSTEPASGGPTTRASFLRGAGGGVAFAALALTAVACGDDDEDAAAPAGTTATGEATAKQGGDIDIVNYALTLEFLEADFYDQVVQSGVLDGKALELAKAFGSNEQEHVDALTATVEGLGGTPAARPKTRFELTDRDTVLETALDIENLGAAAYLGQAAEIEDKQILAAALSIHAVEARHAAALNQLLGRPIAPDGALAKPAGMQDVLDSVKPFIVS